MKKQTIHDISGAIFIVGVIWFFIGFFGYFYSRYALSEPYTHAKNMLFGLCITISFGLISYFTYDNGGN